MTLSRDDIGQRVIVRRLLPGETGPSGGPAMTDVLGVLVAFDTSSLAVEREDGEMVTIPRGDLVTGKPIPPRPAARMRISADALQRVCAAGWVAPDHERLGDWLLRAASGFTSRANSVLATGDPGVPLRVALDQVEGYYRDRGLPPRAQVVDGSTWMRELVGLGWEDARPDAAGALVLVTSVARACRVRPAPTGAADVILLGEPTDEWLRLYGRTADHPEAVVRSVLARGHAVVFAQLGSPVIAIGRAVVTGDWVGLYAVEVAAGHRRRGSGSAVTSALLSWGASLGALSAYLQTLEDNAAAARLFSRFGFETHHAYRYLTPRA
ncbi:MAG: GNAT family N-acetyltransferase [Actinomycetota bacterium]|nr:GNAT family N-acetyltransferase [Actinomycetota bacterium]